MAESNQKQVSQNSATAQSVKENLSSDERIFAGAKSAGLKPVKSTSALKALLDIEQHLRDVTSEDELVKVMANDARRVLGFRQALVLSYSATRNQFIVKAVTSFPQVDRSAPMIQWVERMVKNIIRDTQGKQVIDFMLPAFCHGDEEIVASYPFVNVVYAPVLDREKNLQGCILFMRDALWIDADKKVAERVTGTYAHAISALSGKKPKKLKFSKWRLAKWMTPILLVGCGLIPVPLSTLAPVEVLPQKADVVASPSEGIISSVEVEPNQQVSKGDVLVRLNDTDLSNQLAVAQRNVEVSKARLKRSNQAAFFSPEAKRELATTRAELQVARAEEAAIAAQLARSVIEAPEDGVALFRSQRELVGRPVSVGDRLMRIADPQNAEFRIELPVSDAIIIERQSQVRVFLDTDPLNAIDAVLDSSSYHAAPTAEGILAYVLEASPADTSTVLRVGGRGTAKLIGDDVPLYFFLFRKPIAKIRQWTGF